ncbi:MAG: phospholipase D-like domain-containing protein [Verrucomicrobia bacterium]|nr:phospholipase D-like domain-containing protein [Verrucomicrobiota bacterium]
MEYQPQVLHAKLIVIDDVVYVGSSNLDPRSLRINFEIMLSIKDAVLVAAARQQFEADLARHSTPITSDALRAGRTWWVRLRQRLAYWLVARLDPELAALMLHRWHGRKDRLLRRIKRVRGTARPAARCRGGGAVFRAFPPTLMPPPHMARSNVVFSGSFNVKLRICRIFKNGASLPCDQQPLALDRLQWIRAHHAQPLHRHHHEQHV